MTRSWWMTAQLILFAAVVAAPAVCRAVDLGISSDTIVRVYERDDRNGRGRSLLPVYEFMRLDYGSVTTPGLSLHAYGWGRLDLRDSHEDGDAEGDLLYAYLEYIDPDRDHQVRLGRQYLFEGVMRESFDGLYARTELVPTVALSAFAGMPVGAGSAAGRSGDLVYGARIVQGQRGRYDAGISYKYVANDGSRSEELLGADLSLSLPAGVSMFAHSTLNLLTGGWAEHSYEARIPFASMELRPFYQRYRYSDYLNDRSGASRPFRFQTVLGDRVEIAGAEGFWYPTESVEFGGRYKYLTYDSRFGNAHMATALATVRRGIFSEAGLEFGRVQGDLTENRYYLGRGYLYGDFAPWFATGDVTYVRYDRAIYGENSALFVSAGVGRKMLDRALSLKLSVDYSNDPYFHKDYRGTLAVTYAFRR